MPDFRLRKDAENWFKHIAEEPPLTTKFDLYYLCLMLGLAARRASDPVKSGTSAPGFVDQFVREYKGQERLILGLLLRAELAGPGYEPDERDEVRQTLAGLVEGNGLSDKGVSRLNEYASGGFDALQERYGDVAPYSTEEFLPRYVGLLREVVDNEPTWVAALGGGGPRRKKAKKRTSKPARKKAKKKPRKRRH